MSQLQQLQHAFMNYLLASAAVDTPPTLEQTTQTFKDKIAEEDKIPFENLVNEVKKYALALVHAEKRSEYDKIVAEYLGKGRNVKDCDESQYDMILLIIQDLKEYCDTNNIEV